MKITLSEVLVKVKAGEDVLLKAAGKEMHFRFVDGKVVRYGGDHRAYGPVEDWDEAGFLKEFADKKLYLIS